MQHKWGNKFYFLVTNNVILEYEQGSNMIPVSGQPFEEQDGDLLDEDSKEQFQVIPGLPCRRFVGRIHDLEGMQNARIKEFGVHDNHLFVFYNVDVRSSSNALLRTASYIGKYNLSDPQGLDSKKNLWPINPIAVNTMESRGYIHKVAIYDDFVICFHQGFDLRQQLVRIFSVHSPNEIRVMMISTDEWKLEYTFCFYGHSLLILDPEKMFMMDFFDANKDRIISHQLPRIDGTPYDGEYNQNGGVFFTVYDDRAYCLIFSRLVVFDLVRATLVNDMEFYFTKDHIFPTNQPGIKNNPYYDGYTELLPMRPGYSLFRYRLAPTMVTFTTGIYFYKRYVAVCFYASDRRNNICTMRVEDFLRRANEVGALRTLPFHNVIASPGGDFIEKMYCFKDNIFLNNEHFIRLERHPITCKRQKMRSWGNPFYFIRGRYRYYMISDFRFMGFDSLRDSIERDLLPVVAERKQSIIASNPNAPEATEQTFYIFRKELPYDEMERVVLPDIRDEPARAAANRRPTVKLESCIDCFRDTFEPGDKVLENKFYKIIRRYVVMDISKMHAINQVLAFLNSDDDYQAVLKDKYEIMDFRRSRSVQQMMGDTFVQAFGRESRQNFSDVAGVVTAYIGNGY